MAAPSDRLPSSVQESIATCIAIVDDRNSQLISKLVEPELFDEPYDDIVAACLAHRRQHGKPPGRQHIDDVFANVLEDEQHKRRSAYLRIIGALSAQSDGIDSAYVLTRVTGFVELRKLRAGLAHAVERYQEGGDDTFGDIEQIFRNTLRIRTTDQSYGFSLADDRAMGFLDRSETDYCNLGIRELDVAGAVPTKKELLGFLSPPNRGKSFFLTHCGKKGLMHGWQIAHYTLENSDDMTAQRYFQTLFSGVKREGDYHYALIESEDGEQPELRHARLKPEFVIEDREGTVKFLSDRTKQWHDTLQNLRIRRFPSGKLSFDDLERDLDEMALMHDFVPDMLLVDMPQLMRLRRDRDRKDYAALDELVTQLRGLAVERNMAVVCPQQGNRSSASATNVQAQHGAGSFGIFGIADNLITYSQTLAEEEHGLARLYLNKVRNDRARQTVCITQHYPSGQFCMSSHVMNKTMQERVKAYIGAAETDDLDDEEAAESRPRRVARG